MSMPQWKVNVTHATVATDYTSDPFTQLQVRRRENNYDVATLWFDDVNSQYYGDSFSKFDEVKIYLKDAAETAYTQVFGGNIREVIPTVNSQGVAPRLLCKGYGAALEETHCNRDYGSESANPTLHHAKLIGEDLVDNLINKSLGSGVNTGYAITKTKIADIAAATAIKYINNPFRTNLEVVDLVCELTSAIGAGATAGAHWIVDNSKNLIINTIAAHENTAEWPDWWNTDQTSSTLTQGIDFTDYTVLDKAEEFANNVVLITDFRRPAYDYWTEDSGGAALWGNDGLTSITDDNAAGHFVVGSHSVNLDPNGAVQGYGYYPSTFDANWDVTKWGSIRTIPTLNFYCWKHALTTATTYVYLSTNNPNRKTDFFYATFLNWATEPDDTWLHKSLPIGPYWASSAEARQFRWGASTANANWANIDSVEFTMAGAGAGGYLLIDDLHFTGKIARSAKNSTSITANNEYQKVLISRNSMDDSCVAADDTGFAGRVAYGELLRRQSLPLTITFFTATDMKAAMAGQKLHVHACKKLDGAFRIDATMRITEIQEDLALPSGYGFTVTATTDLLNSRPISVPDQYAMWQENMFLNSAEAKNIRSGAEVDLLIPIMQKDYP